MFLLYSVCFGVLHEVSSAALFFCAYNLICSRYHVVSEHVVFEVVLGGELCTLEVDFMSDTCQTPSIPLCSSLSSSDVRLLCGH